MKLANLIAASAFYATASAWKVTFIARDGHKKVDEGIRTNTSCSNVGWVGVNARDIREIHFKPATKHRVDPTMLTVYSTPDCVGNSTSFKKGTHKPATGFRVASYKVNN